MHPASRPPRVRHHHRALTLLLKDVWRWMLVNELRWQLSRPRHRRVHWVRRVGKQSVVMMHVMWHVGRRRRRRMHGRMEFSRVWQHHHFTNSVFFHHLSCNIRNETSVRNRSCKYCTFNKASLCLRLYPQSDSQGCTHHTEPQGKPSVCHWKQPEFEAAGFKRLSLTHQSAKQPIIYE